MKIAVAIPNHNQFDTVQRAIESIMAQSVQASHIFIMSDADPWPGQANDVIVPINNGNACRGRCGNRNSAIVPFMESGDDILIFIDGDCVAENDRFLEEYTQLLEEHQLVFGCRRHTPVDGLVKPASDLLTANMDNLWSGDPLDYTDLRMASGAVVAWHDASSIYERIDLMLTGMIGWSCNFGITRDGLDKLLKFMQHTHGRQGELFDSDAFGHGWGYEDVAMGLDAIYAGLDVWISDTPRVVHLSHERSDGLFDHVRGRHMIMDRYRKLNAAMVSKYRAISTAATALLAFIAGIITMAICG